MSFSVFTPATSIAAAIRRRHVSAVEVLEAHLTQIERWNPRVNAIVTIDEADVRQRARAADDALRNGHHWGPLHGVPVTVKDAIEVQGMRTTCGYPPLQNYIPSADAAVVARVRSAGAIILAKTNTETLTLGFQCRNPIFGRTNNPWDEQRTSGGSSGGDAAAVACGMSALSIGTDSGGSVRIPAHYCGVCAVKPTQGRVSTSGVVPRLRGVGGGLRHLNTIGLVARSVEDLVLGLGLIIGPGTTQWDVPPVPLETAPPRAWTSYRVAWIEDLPDLPVTLDTRLALRRLVGDLRDLGCTIEPCRPEIDRKAMREVSLEIFAHEFLSCWDREESPDVPALAPRGSTSLSMSRYMQALEQRDRDIATLERFFDRWDALISPVTVGPAFQHCPAGTPFAIDGQTVDYWSAGVGFTSPYNLTGHPAVVIPLAQSREELPIGLQLIGKRWSEPALLSLAQRIAQVTGPFRPPLAV